MYSVSLLSDKSLVEAPFVKVDIGEYTFGIFQRQKIGGSSFRITYPNYIKSLDVTKINGTVNQYTLNITYPITAESDPNFFEKVFSSVSDTRKIIFSYGDFATPNYIYGNEEALITDVNSTVDMGSSTINYVVKAVSNSAVAMGGSYTFPKKLAKPSNEIRRLLKDPRWELTKTFTGMVNMTKVEAASLIASDDAAVNLEAQYMSPLDYLNYLVSCMKPNADTSSGYTNNTVYILVISDDKEGLFGGPYFKVQKIQRNATALDATTVYTIDVGYPTGDIVTKFDITNQQGYSILYDYSGKIDSYNYGKRIDDNGNISYVKANPLTSSKQLHLTTEQDRSWWTKVTEFPISVDITLRGLLRPAILMNYVKLNVWFYGRKHISSGYYIITAQKDSISESGFRTKLSLTRIAPDGDIDIAVGMFGEKLDKEVSQNGDLVNTNSSSIKDIASKNKDFVNKFSSATNTSVDLSDVYVHTGNNARNTIKIGKNSDGIVTTFDNVNMTTPWVDRVVKGKK